MKNILWGFSAGLLCGILVTMVVMSMKIEKEDGSEVQLVHQTTPATAEAEKVKGLLVFTNSHPTQKYNTIGCFSIQTSIFGCSYQYARKKTVERVLEEYPVAQGIILDFETDHYCIATIITF